MHAKQRSRFLSASGIVLLVLASLTVSVSAPVADPDCSVEPQNQTVAAGSTFTVNVWIRNLPAPGMDWFEFKVVWDPSMVEYVGRTRSWPIGWLEDKETIQPQSYYLEAHWGFFGFYSLDHSWVTITFRCLRAGTTQIAPTGAVVSPGSLICDLLPATVNHVATVNQVGSTVGGYVVTANRLIVLAPYLVMIGSVAVIPAVYLTKRRR